VAGNTYFISAGEYSGDVLGAELVLALQQVFPKLSPVGVAGPNMRKVGVTPIAHVEDLNVMGVWEIAKNLGDIRLLEQRLIHAVEITKPNFAILIDFPGLHFRLAEAFKMRGVEVIQYVAPKLWAWGAGRLERLRRDFDLVLGVLPFEGEFFQKGGVNYRYVGTPQIDRADRVIVSKEALGLPLKRPLIALLPGSRKTEVTKILPYLRSIKNALDFKVRGAIYVVPVPPSLNLSDVIGAMSANETSEPSRILGTGPLAVECEGIYFIEGMSLELMGAADVAVVASGTATLECALVGTPMVVVYAVNDLTYALASRALTVSYVSLVNLIAGKKVVNEHIQKIDPAGVAGEISELLHDGGRRTEMLEQFRALRDSLQNDAASRAAAAIAAHAGNGSPASY